MKTLLVLGVLILSIPFAVAEAPKEATGWSLLAGQSSLIDGRKMAEETEPTGSAFKGSWAHRTKYFEYGLMVRYTSMSDDITFENVDGELKSNDLTFAFNGGFWPFSWLKLHGGYAFHLIKEKVTGDYTDSQNTDIEEEYRLNSDNVYGIYGGADLVLYQTKSFQFFANYDYYYLNGKNAHQWEAMAGMRFYLSGKSSVGKGNFFVKMFSKLFNPDEK